MKIIYTGINLKNKGNKNPSIAKLQNHHIHNHAIETPQKTHKNELSHSNPQNTTSLNIHKMKNIHSNAIQNPNKSKIEIAKIKKKKKIKKR